jgi:endonuclease/exonuclease/phosphatase family metal-dependent hydrolase
LADDVMKSLLTGLVAGFFLAINAPAQILMSGGTNYSQNFDTLASSGTGNAWTDNVTLPGWYAATNSTSAKSGPVTLYIASAGSATGSLYSFGENGSPDRALGSVASGTPGNFAYGVRFANDTDFVATNIVISYTGEQWRAASTNVQSLAFSYQVGGSLTNADAQNAQPWVAFPALDFNSPNTNATQNLPGNDPTNRVAFSNIVLAGVAVPPGRELFLRWYDANDAGNDDGLAIDDLTVRFETNAVGAPVSLIASNRITLMTYNVKGNGAADWSTNSAQVRAIGREIVHLQPDIITFNEIPHDYVWQMTNWVTAFMPGFYLATNSGTDGFINSVIASRFPIVRSQKWLDGADLDPFGYTNANFTRDLFEAEIAVPGWAQHLHVFTTHLKASSGTNYADNLAKRAAEVAAITNFIATNMLALYPLRPFTLSGDMNESGTNQLSIQRLISAPTTLRLTNPQNPYTGSLYTYDSATPNERIDYIFPCTLLFSNIISSQVFRADKLPAPLPPDLNSNDSQTASDHLPVLMTFANPFAQPFGVTAFGRSHQAVSLQWQSVPGGIYRAETSTNLTHWTALAPDILATNYSATLTTNASEAIRFFRVRTQ